MAQSDSEIWRRWDAEIKFAEKDKKYVAWIDQSRRITKRYRDERPLRGTERRRLNILWSNVETLRPAVYAKMPKPIVERRFMDRDPAARMASQILERCLAVQMETGYFDASMKQAVMDHLLPGMGVAWVRYEPQFEAAEEGAENADVEAQERTAEEIEKEGDGAPYEKLAYERVCVDYVYYEDFLWGSARFWREVPWVSRRCWMTTSEIAERFYAGDMEKARQISLDYMPEVMRNTTTGKDETTAGYFKKAEIREIWNKADQTVYFIPPGTPDIVLEKQPKPELKLEGFWPTVEPLFATQTNDTLVPVPDYIEYQDQAGELDDLTARIAALTTACKVAGVYDASVKELARLLQEGNDNRLIPVDQWAAFAEKGGIPGAISLVPLKEIMETLLALYQARAQVKNDLFEVTGMSDIVRGQSEGAQKTATEQRIKGQFASMRLEDRRAKVAEFCRGIIRVMAEVISEMFGEDTLMQMSGMDQTMADKVRKAVEQVPPPPEPEPPEGVEQMPPEQQQQVQMAMQQARAQGAAMHQQMQQQVAQQVQSEFMAQFQEALAILKSDKLRGFRVDIETDNTISSDAAADKQAATELVQGTLEGLTAAGPIVAQAPELMRPIGDLLMFAYRKFRVGRTVEASLEDALDQINDKIESSKGQPPPPSPEEQKAQAQIKAIEAKTQADMHAKQADLQMNAQKTQADLGAQQAKNAMDMQRMREEMALERERAAMEMEIERQKMALEREKMGLERDKMMMTAAVDAAAVSRDTQAAERDHELKSEEREQKHTLDMATAEAKAKAAQKPKDAK